MSERLNLVCPKQYEWAYNKVKLNQAYSSLVLAGEINQKSFDEKKDEAAIKASYISRKGLLVNDQEKNLKKIRPRNTSNVDKNNG